MGSDYAQAVQAVKINYTEQTGRPWGRPGSNTAALLNVIDALRAEVNDLRRAVESKGVTL